MREKGTTVECRGGLEASERRANEREAMVECRGGGGS